MAERLTIHNQIAGFVLGRLDFHERDVFEEHLAVCDECRGELSALSTTATMLDAAPGPQLPPPDLRARTLAAVDLATGAAAVELPAIAGDLADGRSNGDQARRATNGDRYAAVPWVEAPPAEPARRPVLAPERIGAARERRRPRRALFAPRRLGLALAHAPRSRSRSSGACALPRPRSSSPRRSRPPAQAASERAPMSRRPASGA